MKKIYILIIAILIGGIAKGQWQKCNGPYAGFISCFAYDSNYIFTGTNNGIYKTSNNGQIWTEVSNGLSQKSISSMAFCGPQLYAGTLDSGLFISTDNGLLWTAVNGISNKHIRSIVVKDSNIYLATSNSGLIYSQNNGLSWSPMGNTGLNLYITDIAVNDSVIFVATQNGLYKTYNNGINWQQVNLPISGLSITSIAINGYKVVINSGNGIFISENNGNTWTAANNNPYLHCGYMTIIISDTTLYLGTYSCGIYKSNDNGANWIQINNGLYTKLITKLIDIGNTLYAGTYGGGVYKSDNTGISWSQNNTGITNTNIYSMAGNGTDIYTVDLYGNGIQKSSNNGVNWTSSNNGILDRRYFFDIIAKDSSVFALNYQGIFRSIDNGVNWTKNNSGIDTNTYITSIAFLGNKIIASDQSNGGIYITNDNGINWISHPSNLGSYYGKIKSFAISDDTIYAVTSGTIIKSLNGGLSWLKIHEANTADFHLNKIFISGDNILVTEDPSIVLPGQIYVGWLALSNDNGSSWIDIDITPENPYVYSIASYNSFAFAATSRGIYLSTNNGYNWIDISSNLNHINIIKVIINGNFIYASLKSGGIYKRPLSDFVGINETIPKQLSLYPNPANNTLTLNLSQLQQLQNATVSIYDIQGKQLLQKSITEAQTQIDISNFAKGIYIVKLQTEKETLQSKFVKE